ALRGLPQSVADGRGVRDGRRADRAGGGDMGPRGQRGDELRPAVLRLRRRWLRPRPRRLRRDRRGLPAGRHGRPRRSPGRPRAGPRAGAAHGTAGPGAGRGIFLPRSDRGAARGRGGGALVRSSPFLLAALVPPLAVTLCLWAQTWNEVSALEA